MNSKKWIKRWFFISTFIFSIGVFNYIIDPYGLNGFYKIEGINDKKLSNTSIATRVKTAILQGGGFDTVMLGTSRIGVIDPEVVDKHLGGKTVNLEYPASITPIQKKLFFYALKYNNIKNVLYGIDFLSFNQSRTIHGDFQEFYDFETEIENKERIFNLDMYFNLNTFYKSINIIVNNDKDFRPKESVYLMKNGMRDYINHIQDLKDRKYDLDENINKSIENYFRKDAGEYQNYVFSYEYLKDFKEVVEYCQANNIKLWVYISPMYSKHYDAIHERGYADEFKLFKWELSRIVEYTDMTGHTELTVNTKNYWDSSHLRKELSETIVPVVLKKSNNLGIAKYIKKYNLEKVDSNE